MLVSHLFCCYIYFPAIHKIPTRVFQRGCGCGLHILPSLQMYRQTDGKSDLFTVQCLRQGDKKCLQPLENFSTHSLLNIFYPDPGFLGLFDENEDGVWSLDKILLPVGIVLKFYT